MECSAIKQDTRQKDVIMKQNVKKIITCSNIACMFVMLGAMASANAEVTYRTPISLMPYAELSTTYDSNFFRLSDDEESELYLDLLGGLELSYTGVQGDALATVFASARRHDDFDDEDFETIGQSLRLRYGTRDTVQWRASQSYRRVTEEDTLGSDIAVGDVTADSALDTATSAERDIFQAAISAGVDATDKTQLDFSYRYDFVDYTDRVQDKITIQTIGAEAAYRITDKSSGLLTTRYGWQDSDGLDDSAGVWNVQAGARTESTDKLTFRATAGYQHYDRKGDLGSDESLAFDVRATLVATDKLTFQAGGRNGTQLSSTQRGNAADYFIYYLGARMQATDAIDISANAAYREDDYLDPVMIDGQMRNRTDKGTAFRLRANYTAPSDYLSLFTQLTFDDVDSPTGDYDRTKVSAGLRLQY